MVAPNRLLELEAYVRGGGGLLMIGGYLSFAGIEGKARYHGTPVEEALPVVIGETDDRVEAPQGVVPSVAAPDPRQDEWIGPDRRGGAAVCCGAWGDRWRCWRVCRC